MKRAFRSSYELKKKMQKQSFASLEGRPGLLQPKRPKQPKQPKRPKQPKQPKRPKPPKRPKWPKQPVRPKLPPDLFPLLLRLFTECESAGHKRKLG